MDSKDTNMKPFKKSFTKNSEGELKKRIKIAPILFKIPIDPANKKILEAITDLGDQAQKQTFKILDSAKKEYPSCFKCSFYLKDENGCPYSAEGMEGCCPKEVWKKKWFGEP